MGLRAKFNLVMIVAFGIGYALAGGLTWQLVREDARREVVRQAEIMMASAQAVRKYTTNEIRPLIADRLEHEFLPHSVPSYAAQTNLRALHEDFPAFTYKEAALNPTNPIDRATDWEADLIHEFRNDPERTEIVSQRMTPTGLVLNMAQPIRVSDPSCLTCHSVPAAAPASMIDMYGTANGFGWQLDEVIGAQVVTVPMSAPLDHARRGFFIIMGVLATVFITVIVILNLLLHYVVIRPVVKMSAVAEAVSLGRLDVEEYERKGSDEISSLSQSFARMRRSLENALQMLGH